MRKKYFAVANTYNIKQHLGVKNIQYSFSAKSLNHAPKCQISYKPDYDAGFFQHIRFYEIIFNNKEQPIRLHALGVVDDDAFFELGWFDYTEHMSKINFKNFFLINNKNECYFNSAEEMYEALHNWVMAVAEEKVRERIIDGIRAEEGEF